MEFTALGAHIYAGTHTLGTQRHFRVLAHFEDGYKAGIETARLNWPEMPIHDKPWPAFDYAGTDYIYCNPPCAIFSAAGIRTTRGAGAWRTDPRRGCWYDCFNLIDSIKPRALSIESVTQAYSTGREMIDELTKLALVRGYSVTHVLIDARWMGVPQKRRRFFFVAHRPNGLVYRIPNWAPPTTVGEALAEALTGEEPIAEVLDKHREALRICKPGEGLREAWEKLNPAAPLNHLGHVTGRPSFNEGRLDASKPMGAMIGNFYWHPTEDRRLTPSELKSLCGVPDSFQLWGPTSHWASLLARGVMPAVASWLGEAVKDTLHYPDGDWRDRTVKLVDLRDPGREVVDLTSDYLDENGRVRMRVPAGRVAPRTEAPASLIPPVPAGSAFEAPVPDRVREKPIVVERSAEVQENPDFDTTKIRERYAERKVVIQEQPSDVYGHMQQAPDLVTQIEVIDKIKTTPPDLEVYGDGLKPLSGEGSGRFMQRLWRDTRLSPDEILALVHANWQGRTTKRSDVYYNYRKLVDAGEAVRPWSVERASRNKSDATRCPGCGAPLGSGCPRDKETPRVGCYLLGGPPARRGFSDPAFEQGHQSEHDRVHHNDLLTRDGDPTEGRVGPVNAGRSESQTLRADEGPVATSRPSAGAAPAASALARSQELEITNTGLRQSTSLPKTFKSLADRSGVVPERAGEVETALMYMSAVPTPEEKPNPVSSVRMNWFLEQELKPDVCYNQNSYPTDVIPKRIGTLVVVNSSWTWMKDEWRRISMRLFDTADRVVFCQNDYSMYLHSYHMGRIREDANYVVLSTCKDLKLHRKHGVKAELVNWNALTYIPRPENDVERQCGVYYYGSMRKGRQRVFDRYFRQSNAYLTVSASNGTEVKKFSKAYPAIRVVPRSDNVFEELERWESTLILEDERATKEYVSPPNRFYEALSSRCPMIFDHASVPMFQRYGYDITGFVVRDGNTLAGRSQHWQGMAEDQQAWHRDYIGELRTQFHEVWKSVTRGECGRTGAPPGLKRYSFTEEGGER